MAEQAFLEEFAKLVGHLTERISGVGEDGKPKVFRDSAVGNLGEFFERFKSLNVRSNDQLDALVAQAQQAVRGVGARDLRDNDDLRQRVASQLSGVQSALDGMLVDRPRRKIIRPDHAEGGVMNLVIEKDGRSGASTARRSPWMPSGRSRSSGPAMSSPTTRVGGWPTCRPSGGRSSAPSRSGARPWRRKWRGWRRTG